MLEHVSASRDEQTRCACGHEHLLRDGLGQVAVLSTLHVKTLDLGRCPSLIFNLDCRVLLFLQKEQSLENTIKVNLEQLVSVVHGLLELRGNLQCLREVRDTRIDEDGVRVSIDNLETVERKIIYLRAR